MVWSFLNCTLTLSLSLCRSHPVCSDWLNGVQKVCWLDGCSTWLRSDMRKSSLDPGSPSSINVLTNRRSALLPGKITITNKFTTDTPIIFHLKCFVNLYKSKCMSLRLERLPSSPWTHTTRCIPSSNSVSSSSGGKYGWSEAR